MRLQRLEAVHRDLDGVGVRRDVDEHEVAARVRDDVGQLRAARFADERDGRAGNDAALRVLDRAGDRAGRDLRGRGRRRSGRTRTPQPR